jgi:hypothetical protein
MSLPFSVRVSAPVCFKAVVVPLDRRHGFIFEPGCLKGEAQPFEPNSSLDF